MDRKEKPTVKLRDSKAGGEPISLGLPVSTDSCSSCSSGQHSEGWSPSTCTHWPEFCKGCAADCFGLPWHIQSHIMTAGDNCLVSLVVKAPASNHACDGIFLGLSHTSDLKIGTPVANLPGAWHYRVSAGTGWPGVSILWLGEMDSLICNFYLSVAANKIVWADPSLRYTRMLLGH